jgi:putative transposase
MVGVFPNPKAVIRLVDAVLAEQNNEWTVARRYLGVESLTVARSAPVDDGADLLVLAEAS